MVCGFLYLERAVNIQMVALFGIVFATDVDAARFGTVLTYMIASTSSKLLQ